MSLTFASCQQHQVPLASVYDGAGRWLRYLCPLCEHDTNPLPTSFEVSLTGGGDYREFGRPTGGEPR